MKIFQPTLLLLVVFVLFQFMINGFLAQTSPCTWLTCMNNGTCYIDNVTGSEMCNCTPFYQGMMCEQKIPSYVWTMDELCRLYFGPDYYSDTFYNPGTCSNVMCRSISDPYLTQIIDNAKGLICAPNSVCVDNSMCYPVMNGALNDLVDRMVGNMSCQEYLTNSSLSFAKTFCMDPMAQTRCPVACLKYNTMACTDMFKECAFFGNFCNSSFEGKFALVKDLCPFTCNQCPDAPLRCDIAAFLCQNGGTCQNTTVTGNSKIGFRCSCPPQYKGEYCEMKNPCFGVSCPSGKKCTQVGFYNYVCA